jgi:hypothetical protein
MPVLGIVASQISGHLFAPSGAYDSIATVTLGTAASSVTFSSIPSTYTHLQVRVFARSARADWGDTLQVRVNGDTGANYYGHYLLGNGAATFAGSYGATTGLLYCGTVSAGSAPVGTFGGPIIDILDYTSANKNKVFRVLHGADNNSSNGAVGFLSAAWNNSSTAINSLVFSVDSASNFAQYTSFALYGIKGN